MWRRRGHRRRGTGRCVPNVPSEEDTPDRPLPMQDTCEEKSKHDEKKESSSGSEDSRSDATTSRPQGTPLSVPAVSVGNISGGTSSIAANLQELSLKKEDHGALSAEERPVVIFPKHFHVSDADLSSIKFGNFDAGEIQNILRSRTTQPINYQPYARNQEYDQLKSPSDRVVGSTPDIVLRDFGSSSTSQPEIAGTELLDLAHEPQYNFPSVSGYSLPSSIGIGPGGYLQQQNPYPASNLMLTGSDTTTSSHLTQQSLSTTSVPTGHMQHPHLPVIGNFQSTVPIDIRFPFMPQSYAYPYQLPTIDYRLSGSGIPTGVQGGRRLGRSLPRGWSYYVRFEPSYYPFVPQQSFSRPMPAMLTGTPSSLFTDSEEDEWNHSSWYSSDSEDSQSPLSDQMSSNQ